MKNKLKAVLVLTAGGLVFSGYLSAVKLLTGACPVSGACPYFLGYPACWYGLAMYLAMFAATLAALFQKLSMGSAARINICVSLLGILFAGRFVMEELYRSEIFGALGLSTCSYGLIFYILIFVLSLWMQKEIRKRSY